MEFREVRYGFTLAAGGDFAEVDPEILKAVAEQLKRAMLDRLNREIAEAFEAERRRRRRTCFSGHVHLTFQGRLFCDTMRGHL